jgi:hypothetical protein
MPRKKEKEINYNDLIITKIPRTNLSDITIVELQKLKNYTTITEDKSLIIQLESIRDLEIVSKHVKRDIPTVKSDSNNLTMTIHKSDLPKLVNQDILTKTVSDKVNEYFKTKEFLKMNLKNIEKFLNYGLINEKGRLEVILPNEQMTEEIQKILLISKIFFIQEGKTKVQLPWNSILFIQAFITFPKDHQEQYLDFAVKNWLPSNAYHKIMAFEIELEEKQEKIGQVMKETEAQKQSRKTLKKGQSRRLKDFL